MRSLLFALPCALVFIVLACNDDDTSTPSGGVDAGGADGGHAGHDSGSESFDASPPSPIRCTDEELAASDMTDGGSLVITFPTASDPKQYENRCATVKVGASVTFSGSFAQHPLEPAGGDSPSPIPFTEQDQPDNKLVVTMSKAGTFGFECAFHPTFMFGAIRVVP